MNAAESAGVPFHFEQRVLRMDVETGKATLENLTNQDRYGWRPISSLAQMVPIPWCATA